MTRQARIPSTEQLNDLLSKVKLTKPFGLRDWAILHLSYYAGLRAKEIGSLRIQDMYEGGELLTETYLEADQTKNTTDNKDGRKVYLSHPKLRDALNEYVSVETKKFKSEVLKRPLFLSSKNLSISADSMVHIIKRAYRKVGYPNLSSHSGRRYFATKLGSEVNNAKELQEYGGWKSIQMAYKYVETNEEEMKDRLNKATW